MKIPNVNDNGNVVVDDVNVISEDINNISWLDSNNIESKINNSVEENIQFNLNRNIYSPDIVANRKLSSKPLNKEENESEPIVCNIQYRLNHNKIEYSHIGKDSVEKREKTNLCCQESSTVDANVSTNTTPADEERAFDLSDSDEMSEKSIHPVPRGIVNPNYPGFQHLAHTLQEYSSNIEPYYHSENDMTDDDLDADIIESNYNVTKHFNNEQLKGDNNNEEIKCVEKENVNKEQEIKKSTCTSRNDIPDLLKTISHNNNNVDSANYDFNCSTTDIENNFHTTDIIGDFNKEVEDEIRHLLNYNINIEDDLEELRKDIKETFVKPIETTINNISDVVNHVIKKLVENDGYDKNDTVSPDLVNDHEMEDVTNINKENECNTRTEMNISRPTFLLIDNNVGNKITDAILSDGKDEINIYEEEYDTEQLSHNVENTIKQLSTELRKIIPKLNEMRERDKLWAENKKDIPVITDGNSNNILPCSSNRNCETSTRSRHHEDSIKRSTQNKLISKVNQHSIKTYVESKVRQNFTKTVPKCQNASVRKNDQIESDLDSFDVYNIETALPKLDFDTIESHLRAAKDAERRKRNDREEIRKRLAMGVDTDEYYSLGHIDRPGKKPSLHSRLQNGKNLQICFMNETASDNESQTSDIERNFNCNSKSSSRSSLFSKNNFNHPYQTRPLSVNITKHEKNTNTQSGAKTRPTSLMLKSSKSRSTQSLGQIEFKESDFFALQATLQTEARIALAQAKEMARIQMERERRTRAVSPVTEMLRRSMEKASAPLATDRRRVSRHLLTDMNIAQLQVIVNELHSQIEALNDSLVKLLMARDELHMGQDSMLVDIEDLTRYLGVKEQTKKTKGTTKSGVKRLTSLVHK
ncbi:schwannomin-interacting protein 1 homolog isoform X1 [Vanessa atalanta]|uniref:schwannomin-interacting protein 1 homolog isoform X1 n=2 Tax=Vanessa atalanta TaxID=42275 RepID=UPI001FCDD2D6|nr:schwannomin-interacting protein 1 homolog isoform X1 [Vanessa atalanta]